MRLEFAPTATMHGGDMLHDGFTIEQVIRDYGNVCQAVTNLAVETGALISAREFRTFNRCLDDAMAAVAEYSTDWPTRLRWRSATIGCSP
jgi:hypothetical protein